MVYFNSLNYKFNAETIDELLGAEIVSYVSFHSAKIKDWEKKYPNKSAGL